MKKQIIVIPKNVNEKKIFNDFFPAYGYSPLFIERKEINRGKLIIGEDSVFYDGINILENTKAAVILDSGYMWPHPILEPTEDEWQHYHTNFDEYLRNERESFSLWYSLLEIINDSVPVCINSREAYINSTFKPLAFNKLKMSGITLPPFIVSNDTEKITDFLHNSKNNFFRISLSPIENSHWMERDAVLEKAETNMPLFIQSFSNKDEIMIIACNGNIIYHEPEAFSITDLQYGIRKIQEILNIPLAELYFRNNIFSDFNPSPDFSVLSPAKASGLCESLFTYIKDFNK